MIKEGVHGRNLIPLGKTPSRRGGGWGRHYISYIGLAAPDGWVWFSNRFGLKMGIECDKFGLGIDRRPYIVDSGLNG